MKKAIFISVFFGFCIVTKAQIEIISNGDCGIGTNYPENSESWNKVLNVYGQDHSKIITTTSSVHTGSWSHNSGYYGAPAGGIAGTWSNHPFSIITNRTAKMTILTSGYVGIGYTSPAERLQVAGDVYIPGGYSYWIGNNSDASPRLRMHQSGSNAYIDYYDNLKFRSGASYSADRLTLTTAGNFGIGRIPDPLYLFDVNGSIRVNSTVYSSDTRLKENMKPLNGSLNKLLQVNAYSYNYKSLKISEPKESATLQEKINDTITGQQPDTTEIEYHGFDFDNKTHYGFDAGEIKGIFADVVYEDEKGYMGIDYVSFIPLLINAIQEQNAIIEEMQKEIDALKKSKN